MALARKCDVCGRLHDIYYSDIDERFNDGTYERKYGPLNVNALSFGDLNGHCIRFDLCPGCLDEIAKTIEVKMAGKNHYTCAEKEHIYTQLKSIVCDYYAYTKAETLDEVCADCPYREKSFCSDSPETWSDKEAADAVKACEDVNAIKLKEALDE